MEDEKLDQITKHASEPAVIDEKHRTAMTILFSDIKGSTAYFERKGDVEGLAWVQRHNDMLFPCVENNAGRVIKTIGDAIMAMFNNPVDAVRAAARMQNVLVDYNKTQPEPDQIHIRVGVHTGLGLLQDNDVFGDVVNAAARVQSQCEPDQILVTDVLLSACSRAGLQVGELGRAKMRGKDEPIDIYAVGWSPDATQHVIDDLQKKFVSEIQEMKQSRTALEEELDAARVEWREERRRLNAEAERPEEGATGALETARNEITDEFQKESQSKLERAEQARAQTADSFKTAGERFEVERVALKAQIASLEHRLVESMEQINNPARIATEVREQVQARLEEAKKEWQEQWDTERRRLEERIAKAKDSGPKDPMAEARRLMMERLKAKQEGRAPGQPGAELAAAKEKAEIERDELAGRVKQLEREVQRTGETARRDAYNELRHRYDQKTEQTNRIKSQLEQEVRSLTEELDDLKESSAARILHLEEAVREAEEAVRVQTRAEVKAEYDAKLDEADRGRKRLERRHREAVEGWELERRGFEKQLKSLEQGVKEARDKAFKRSSAPTVEEINRLRHQLEEEFEQKAAGWEEERKHLTEKIRSLEESSGS